MKRLCKSCGENKNLETDFPPHGAVKSGYLFKCKKCCLNKRLVTRHKVVKGKYKCTKCKKIKTHTDFTKNPRKKNGLNSQCKKCLSTQKKQQQYHVVSNRNKKMRMAVDPVYKAHINKLKQENSRKNFTHVMLANAKRRAAAKKLPFTIKLKDIVVPDLCPILKVPFVVGTKGDYELTPSIDRVDNSKGYTKDNVQIITKKANSMKNSATPQELLLLADWISKTFKK